MKILPLRSRQRLAAKMEIQSTALALFLRHGFDAVSIEQIAEQAGTSASTVYRHFGTKPGIVLWDDLDAPVEQAVARRLLAGDSVRLAIRTAFCTALSDGIDDEGTTHLERIRFIFETPAIHGAAMGDELAAIASFAADLAKLLMEDDDGYTAEVLAGACFSVMNSALQRWVSGDGRQPLGALMAAGFDALGWEK